MAITDRRGLTVDGSDPNGFSDPNAGLAIKTPVRALAVSNVTLSGLQTIDGVALAENDRVLLAGQTDATENGVYEVSTGNWQRARDFNGSNEIADGGKIYVRDGTVYGMSDWALTVTNPFIPGTSSIGLETGVNLTGKTVTGGAYSDIASLSASVSNPTLVGPLSSFYAPSADSGNKGALSIQTTWDSGNGGLNGASIVANAVVETTAGAVGAPGAIIAGTLVKGDIVGLDPYGIVGIINNDTAVTSGVGAGIWALTRGAKAGGVVDGIRSTSEVAAGQHPRAGVVVYNSDPLNAYKYGLWTASATDYGVVVGNPEGTSVNDVFPTFPMAVFAKGLGTSWHDGLLLYNATPATAGAQQMSPSIRWGGNGWKTNATAGSQFVDFRADLLPVQGTAAPSSYLRFASSVNNGAYTPNVYFTSGNGVGVGAIPNVAANNGDLTVYRGANSGVIYFGDDGTKYIFQDGTNWQFNGAGLNVGSGGTGLTSFTLGDMIYASAGTTLSKLAGNTTTTRKFLRQTGDGTNSAAPAWDTITAADVPGSALTKTDDTNVTLTLGGSPTTALLNAASITVGWSGTLAASRGGTGLSSLGTGVATALAVNVGSAGAFVTFNGALGTPSSGTLTNATGLPITTGISGLGAGIATFLATPSSANLAAAVTDETGSGALMFGTSPVVTTDIRPASDGSVAIGTSSLRFGTAYLNAITASGQASRTWAMERNLTAATAGQNLTIQAGGAAAGGTDLVGGNLILSAGTSTGSGGVLYSGAAVVFNAPVSGGSTGSGDTTPTEVMRISNLAGGYGALTFRGTTNNGYAITGAAGDASTYFNASTGGSIHLRINNTTISTQDASNFSSSGGMGILNATAIPAGGSTAIGYRFSSTSNFGVFFGSGAPTLSAAKGSLYLRSDGSTTNDRMYVNTNGSTTWTAVITAA